jgi:7-cyano-7-deazaguanine synthase
LEKIYNILWTGGWDSTFRVIQLYRLGVIIQPIYIIDRSRISYSKELESIEKITKGLPIKFPNSKGQIRSLIIIDGKDIPADLYLKLIHKYLRKKVRLGTQYYWLARVAKKYPGIELSLHEEDLYRFFNKSQLLEINDVVTGVSWKINPEKVDFFRRQLFSNMTFPLIEISKPEMKRIAEEDDFFDLMELTWFCHKSTEKPCGKCSPCKQYIAHGFGFRLK